MLTNIISQLYRYLPNDPEQHFRGQLTLGIVSALIVVDFCVLLFFVFFAQKHMDEETRSAVVMLIAVGESIHLISLLALLRGYLVLAAGSVVVVATVAIWCSVWFTSGVPSSPAVPLLLTPVVLSFCLLGPRVGLTVAVSTTLVMLVQWHGVSTLGWQLPALQSRMNPALDSLLIGLVNSFIVIAVLLAYERITAHLRAQRDADRERLSLLATRDDLTGVGNRRDFEARLAQACGRCDRGGDQLAVFYVDLDGFKQINDELGHQAGDEVLCIVADRMQRALRVQDFVARLGGDEFAVAIEPVQDRESVARVAAKLQQIISEPMQIAERTLTVGASIGVSLYPIDAAGPEEVLRRADTAMYQEKHRLGRTVSL